MPKVVDHDARRAELVAALWRVVARDGFDAASVRSIAAESGWSVGAVRYYFRSQADLARFAMEALAERIAARVQGAYLDASGMLREVPEAGTRGERALHTLLQLVPLDEERRAEVLIWLEFMARARFDPSLDEPRALAWNGERYLLRLALADAADLPLPTGPGQSLHEPAETAAMDLLLGIDGLTVQAVTHPEHWPPAAQEEAVRRLLTRAADIVTG